MTQESKSPCIKTLKLDRKRGLAVGPNWVQPLPVKPTRTHHLRIYLHFEAKFPILLIYLALFQLLALFEHLALFRLLALFQLLALFHLLFGNVTPGKDLIL